ncbi:MAG TPA: hypothetical protein VEM57_09155 [Candidatus Binatus sp.]|nr:hypothetical protein [Candidatus Binatus sp.]
MPDAPENEVEVAELVRSIEAGEDKIELPEELVVEPERAADAPPQGTLQARIITMNPSEKIKLALRGNRDARMILIRDGNKMIRRFVLQNPRTSDSEVISLARNKNADNELLQIVTQHREWMRNYQVRLAIATNPKAPLPIALRQVSSLDQRDLRQIAKSKNVPQAIAAHARRILMTQHGGQE